VLVQKAAESMMDEQELLQLSTPKVRKLISILKSFLPKVYPCDFHYISFQYVELAGLAETHSRFSDLSCWSFTLYQLLCDSQNLTKFLFGPNFAITQNAKFT